VKTPVPTSRPVPALVGRLVASRYHIESLLGQGGVCTVYRAEDLRYGRQVAVKVLPAERALSSEMSRRFQREVTTGKRIEHPNVVAITDSGKLDDGALFLVMELAEGPSLASVIHGGRLPLARAVAIARQILVGLDAAHKLGVVHRDVKPENVILVNVDGVETVKLFDFGIAFNDRAAEKLTGAGVAFGTPEYISPEMAQGMAIDARADVYSVGVVLFQMATGKLPFEREDPLDLLRAHIRERPPSPRTVAPEAELPVALERLILRTLEKVPGDRFATAAAMIDALDALDGKRRPKRRGAAAWIAIALSATLVGGGLAWWRLHGDDPLAGARADLEAGRTCAERKAALERLAGAHDPSLLPLFRRARERGPANSCMARDLKAAIQALEP
jgi:serine/threonine-protein kinase